MIEQIRENLYKLNENQYLKKSKSNDWHIIAPVRDPITNKFKWFNFLTGGSWMRLITVIVIIGLILSSALLYARDTKVCRDIIEDSEDFCYKYALAKKPYGLRTGGNMLNATGLNLSLPAEDNAELR